MMEKANTLSVWAEITSDTALPSTTREMARPRSLNNPRHVHPARSRSSFLSWRRTWDLIDQGVTDTQYRL